MSVCQDRVYIIQVSEMQVYWPGPNPQVQHGISENKGDILPSCTLYPIRLQRDHGGIVESIETGYYSVKFSLSMTECCRKT